MKKFLLSCFLALGIGASAQYNAVQNFDGTPPYDGLITFGAGSTASTTVFCSGTTSLSQAYSATVTAGGPAISFKDLAVPQTSNGQAITASFTYRKTAGLVGTLYLTLNTYDPVGDIWNLTVIASRSIATAAVTTCATLSGSIPAGVAIEANLAPGQKYAIGAYFQRASGTGTMYYDDLTISQVVPTAAPDCVAFTAPANGTTVNYGQINFTWPAAPRASEYILTVGTTSGASDVMNVRVPANTLSKFVGLAKNTTYFAKIVPTNTVGDAVGCTEITFTTNDTLNYCGPISISTVEPITNVSFAGINNTSTATTGGTAHENFTAIKGAVELGGSYPISLNGNTDGNFTSYYIVFIDWNQNGILNEAGEVYFANGSIKQTNSNGTTSSPVIGNITVPAGALLGDTRMRVKKEYSSAVPASTSNFVNPCAVAQQFGQIEDYTVTVSDATLASSNATKTVASVYPNPFTDVLKISDVKGVQSVSINDVAGRLVKTMKASAELNVSDLKPGLYIVTLKMEDGTSKTVKAIKK